MFILDQFRNDIPHVFSNLIPLDYLSADSATKAILCPIKELADSILIDASIVPYILEAAAVPGEPPLYDPVMLQLTMERLWKVRSNRRVIDRETLEAIGGPRNVLGSYVKETLSRLTSPERRTSVIMFKHLVTPSGKIVNLEEADIATYVRADPKLVKRVLRALADARLLRSNATPNKVTYSLTHEALVSPIQEYQREFEGRLKQVKLAIFLVVSAGVWLLAAKFVYSLLKH
jgi:conflict system STAND superfamily ATPase